MVTRQFSEVSRYFSGFNGGVLTGFRAGFGGFDELLIWIWEGLGAWDGSFIELAAGWRRGVWRTADV